MRLLLRSCPLLLAAAGCLGAQRAVTPRGVVDAAVRAASAGTLPAFRAEWVASRGTDRRLAALALGSAARLEYHFADASRLLSEAEGDTTRGDALTARAALGRAAIELQQFNLRTADAMLARARTFASRAGATDVSAEALIALVPVRQRLQGVTAALATADSAATALAPTDTVLRVELTCRRAQARVRAGDPGALADAQSAIVIAARLNAPRTEGLCWQTAGQSHQMRDEYREAATAFGRAADRHAAAYDLGGVAASLQWSAFFQRVLGAFDSAQTSFRRAIDAGTTAGNRAPVAWSWLGLSGLSIAAGEPVRAAEEATRATAIMSAIGDRWGLASASSLAGQAALALGDMPRARQRFREAIARSDSLGALSDVLLPGTKLIEVERELDGEAAALARIAWVDTVARRTRIPGWELQRWYHLGLLALRRRDGHAALQHFARFERGFEPGDTSTLPSFDYTVRLAEARSLAGDPLRGARMLDNAIEQFAIRRQRLSSRALRLAIWEQRGGLDSDPDLGIATIIARVAAAGHDTLALRLADARRARDLRAAYRPDAPSRALAPHELLVRFVTGRRGEPTTLLMRRGRDVRSAVLPPVDSLVRRIGALRSLITGDAAAPVLARELGTLLLGPVAALRDPSVTTLIVVPDGALHEVPWAALTLPDGTPLLERVTIALLPSGTLPPSSDQRSIRVPPIAIGTGNALAEWNGERLAPLRRAADEARMVASAARGGRAVIDAAASERAVRTLVTAPSTILHFATHAVVDDRSVSRAAIILNPDASHDGVLDADELAALRIPAQLVVLAGCSTASGLVFASEGLQGLIRPLFDAGAESVVASQWPVRDAAAERLMALFYSEMASDQPTAVALQRAQLRAAREGMAVGDWASWTYTGDPASRTSAVFAPLAPTTPRWLLAVASATVLLALALAYRMLMRRVALRN